ncbi:hypothetical protein [Streptomyces gobiensis]|uniref:hypothetical protein n=1 Tax=Streptomyces gobiensis TaxID=2875706 RepID=UPI001E405C1D|nr:hypothetical protein [Streptomyces gobiensis]UGY90780.1 hypothetical protein test1122_02920 [Streptomyces gobiensis]
MPPPVIMPLVRGELVGLVWVRPLRVGEDALTGIAELANIAAAAGADEVVLAWETHDVATACQLPVVGLAPCLNMVRATRDGHVLHQLIELGVMWQNLEFTRWHERFGKTDDDGPETDG